MSQGGSHNIRYLQYFDPPLCPHLVLIYSIHATSLTSSFWVTPFPVQTSYVDGPLGLSVLLGADNIKKPDADATGCKIYAGMPKFGSTLAWAMESSPAVLKSSERDPALGAIAEDPSKTPVSSSSAKRSVWLPDGYSKILR